MMAAPGAARETSGMDLLLIACIIALCPVTGVTGGCSTSEFQCIYQSKCIPSIKQFNGINDCHDNSDEVSAPWCQKVHSFMCYTSRSCVPISYRNDGQADCADSSDEAKIVGSFCNTSMCCPCEMFIDNSFCDVAVSQCACKPGCYPNNLLSDCIVRLIGESCGSDIECSAVQHSSCVNAICECDDGYYVTNNNTVCSPRVLGDKCTAKSDCTGVMEGSECLKGVCVCHADWFDFTNKTACWHLLLGDSCTRDSLCYAGIDHAFCKSGICNCTAGYIWKENVLDVCRNRLIGIDYCESTSDCGIANSICSARNVCMCTTMYSVTPENYQCTMRGVNENCTGNDQCAGLGNGYCDTTGPQMVCACSTGYKPTPALDSCINNLVGDPCSTDADCLNGFVGGYCTEQKLCACVDGYLTTTTKVCKLRGIDTDPCTTDTDCYAAVANSSCVVGRCNCDSGFTVSVLSNAVCVENVMSLTPCRVDAHCSRYNESICLAAFCGCAPGYKIGILSCTRFIIGEPCSINSTDCSWILNSTCDAASGVCQCWKGYVEENTTTCRRRILGVDWCTTDADCSSAVANSVCAGNKTCLCGPGYEMSADSNLCLEPSASTQTCNDFASCYPWAIALIIVVLLLPPVITGVVMFVCKKLQDRKTRLKASLKDKYGKPDVYHDLGMVAIPTITNFTAPCDTALHRLPEIGADWSHVDIADTSGLIIRDKSFFRDITSITSKEELMTKVEL